MKVTKAYVINLRTIIKYSILFFALYIIIYIFFLQGVMELAIKQVVLFTQKTDHIISAVPVLSVVKEREEFTFDSGKILNIILNENLDNPGRAIANKLSFIQGIKEKLSETYSFVNESNYFYMPKIMEKILEEPKVNENLNPAIETTSKSVKENGTALEKKGITVKNSTTYLVNLDELYQSPLKLKSAQDKPQVLIVHTHGSESYNPNDRNEDINNNIVRLGTEMTEVFKENGINVIHSTVMHDIPKYNNSYKKALETIQKILSENPTINVVLDIHRDAMISANGEVYKVVTNIDGKKSSQVMFVVGTNQGGLTHDNWKENLKFAMKCQEEMNKLHPNLARPINLRKERFNQHATLGSLILEIGTNGNTLNESILSARESAKAISNVLKTLK